MKCFVNENKIMQKNRKPVIKFPVFLTASFVIKEALSLRGFILRRVIAVLNEKGAAPFCFEYSLIIF